MPPSYKLVNNPVNYRYITNKNHSYWSYLHQLNAIVWGHHLVMLIPWNTAVADPSRGRLPWSAKAGRHCWVEPLKWSNSNKPCEKGYKGGSQKHQTSKKKPVSLGVDEKTFFSGALPLKNLWVQSPWTFFHACSMWQPTTEFPKKLGQLSCRFTTVGSLKKPLEAQSFSRSSGSRWSEIAGEENPQLLGSGSFWGWIESPQLKRNIRNSYHLVRTNIAMERSIHL